MGKGRAPPRWITVLHPVNGRSRDRSKNRRGEAEPNSRSRSGRSRSWDRRGSGGSKLSGRGRSMCRATPSTASSSRSQGGAMSSSRSRAERRPSLSSKLERSRSKSRGPKSKPAFDGAAFDRNGFCVRHGTVQLAEQVRQDGKLLWHELKMSCPKCASEHHKSRRVTSLGGAGKVKRGRTVHGQSNPLRNSSRGRHRDKQFDTPFDSKGRCHHHPNVQMASKKSRGGWKIHMQACPRCIEANYDEESVDSRASSRVGGSVSSRSTKRSVTSRTRPVKSSAKYDKNGCCTKHPTVQIAKKKLLGGWKEFRPCPKCLDPTYDEMAETASVGSGRSRRSTTSFRSTGTAKSGRSRKSVKSNGGGKGGRKGDRYGALPFDQEGYCHTHPNVRLAKKKALGGWKVLLNICPECAHEASSNAGSSRASSRRPSSRGTGRVFDDSGSDASSKSGRSGSSRKKKIRVKDMRYRDEHGKEGRYSGEVDEDHTPHGRGRMKYRDGSAFEGVWSGGSQVHGKTTRKKSSSRDGDKDKGGKKGSKSDWARIEGGGGRPGDASESTVPAGNGGGDGGGGKTVRKMKWMDYFGDPGEYTGEVDGSGMPHGKGSMKYDHGLIQEGAWVGGKFVEGSDRNLGAVKSLEKKIEGGKKKRSGGGRSGGERVGRKPSKGSSVRGLDP